MSDELHIFFAHPDPSSVREAMSVELVLKLEATSAAVHETNRLYNGVHGDHSVPPWSEAPSWMKSSVFNGVVGALAGNTPAMSHESWVRQRARDGWKHGLEKNYAMKTHPCMVPYDELPEQQRRKDHIFVEGARVFGWSIGLPVLPAKFDSDLASE